MGLGVQMQIFKRNPLRFKINFLSFQIVHLRISGQEIVEVLKLSSKRRGLRLKTCFDLRLTPIKINYGPGPQPSWRTTPIRTYLSINVRKRREQSILSRQLTVIWNVYYLYNNRTFLYLYKNQSFRLRKLNATWKNSPLGVNR